MLRPGQLVASFDDGSPTMRRWRMVLRWTSTAEREQVLAAARAWQEQERAAARQRIAGLAAILDQPAQRRS